MRCCVKGCQSHEKKGKDNDSTCSTSGGSTKVSLYRFPKNQIERERWIKVVPTESKVNDRTVVCSEHWPLGFETITQNGKVRPKNPPSKWDGVDSTHVTPVSAYSRSTKVPLSYTEEEEEELKAFNVEDKVTYMVLKTSMLANKKVFVTPVVCYMVNDILTIQSTEFYEGVPSFLIKVYCNLRFEAFHYGVKTFIPTLPKPRVYISRWSVLAEIIRFLYNLEPSHKKKIMQEEIIAMSSKPVGEKLYAPGIIVRAFEYYATSRSLYERIRIDYELPTTRTLRRITSKVSNLSDNTFLNSVFEALDEIQKLCILLHDEIYVKKMLLLHGGTIFGKSIDNPSQLAKTLLGIMILCFFGGPEFLSQMLPISRLNSLFLFNQIDETCNAIDKAGGNVKVIICDGNRTNQGFFKKFNTLPGKPWVTIDGKYLLFDFVHLIKNLRNLWLTEKMGELQFTVDGVKKIAKWCHLKELYNLECGELVKMSTLTEVAVAPKPVERQRVAPCLQVFNEKTVQALLLHSGDFTEGKEDTALFLGKVINWWKILNVKRKGVDIRQKDAVEAVISDPDDARLATILEFGAMAKDMSCSVQGKRVKQLSKDTSQAIHHTCNGLVDLCKHLLSTTHDYVCLGKFTTDPLEKEFGKLRQGSGGTYFISVQQVLEKLNIKKTSLLLSLDTDLDSISVESGHQCSDCGYLLEEDGSEIFDNLEELEKSISKESKEALVHIAGYVTRKDGTMSEEQLLDLTTFYYEKYGDYTKSLDRGGLNVPSDSACQWTIFCYIMFNTVKGNVCRLSLTNIFMSVSEFYSFNMDRNHGDILSNLLLKNYCLQETPRSGKEPALKVLKLS